MFFTSSTTSDVHSPSFCAAWSAVQSNGRREAGAEAAVGPSPAKTMAVQEPEPVAVGVGEEAHSSARSEPGVLNNLSESQNLEIQAGPAPCRRPLPKLCPKFLKVDHLFDVKKCAKSIRNWGPRCTAKSQKLTPNH